MFNICLKYTLVDSAYHVVIVEFIKVQFIAPTRVLSAANLLPPERIASAKNACYSIFRVF